nr:MAG: hypothetical protein DIU57_21430 [Pseudomonadota bacterium]
MYGRAGIQNRRVTGTAILNIAAHLIRRVEFLDAAALDKSFGFTRSILIGLPVLELYHDRAGASFMTS